MCTRDGISVVEPHELFGLDVATGENRVGARDERRLLEGAVVRLRLKRVGLHALERVKGHDQGDVEFVLQPMPGQSAQPVVGVQRVRSAVALEEQGDRVGELTHVVGQFFAIQRGRRAGQHVMDAEARFHEHGVLDEEIVATGIDVNLVSEAGKGAREFADVDVHSPAVAGPGLVQGRGVIRENGQARHESILPVDFPARTRSFGARPRDQADGSQ